MNFKFKKVLSVALALNLSVSLLSMTAFAQQSDDDTDSAALSEEISAVGTTDTEIIEDITEDEVGSAEEETDNSDSQIADSEDSFIGSSADGADETADQPEADEEDSSLLEAALKAIEDNAAAAEVKKMIGSIDTTPDELYFYLLELNSMKLDESENNEQRAVLLEDIYAAYDAYTSLTSDQKALVSDDSLALLDSLMSVANSSIPTYDKVIDLGNSVSTLSLDINDGTDTTSAAAIDNPGTYFVTGTADAPLVISASNVSVTLSNVSISAAAGSAIEIGDGCIATLTIPDATETTLVGGENGAGIYVPADAELTINGTGSLTAIGNNGVDWANGSRYVDSSSVITSGGAGIGSRNGKACTAVGKITVTDLTSLTAEGHGSHACGIGGDYADVSIENVKNVSTVGGQSVSDYSGTKEVTGLTSKYGKSDPEGGSAIAGEFVSITDSTVTKAVGGSKGAGIGANYWKATTVVISGSTVSGVVGGGTSAGIGGARNHTGEINITIKDSDVSVTGGVFGAAIGSGYNGNIVGFTGYESNGTLPATNVSVIGSSITAVGGTGAAAIGGGYRSHSVDVSVDAESSVIAYSGLTGGEKLSGSYTKLVDTGAAAIGNGAVGGKTYQDGVGYANISIAQGADITAVSDGGKWAIDLRSVSSESSSYILQGRFLNDTMIGSERGFDYIPENVLTETANGNQLLNVAGSNTIIAGGKTISVPTEYSCVATTVPAVGSYSIYSTADYLNTKFASELGDQTTEDSDRNQTPDTDAAAIYTVAENGITYYDYLAFRPACTPSFSVSYVFTGAVPSDVTAPTAQTLAGGSSYTVDDGTAYTTVSGSYNGESGTFTFAGWDTTGSISIYADTVITGNWTFEATASGGGSTGGSDNGNNDNNNNNNNGNDGTVIIPDEDTPLGDFDTAADDGLTDISDEDIPLADMPASSDEPTASETVMAEVPKTGDCNIAALCAVFSLLALLGINLPARKRKEC